MRKITTPVLMATVLAITLIATACPDRKSRADIENDPGKYQNKEVVVAGRVVDSYGFSIPGPRVGGGAYKLDDGTGSIWILVTDGNVPSRGTQVGVKGVVGSGVNWKGKNYGLGIYEKDRRYPKR